MRAKFCNLTKKVAMMAAAGALVVSAASQSGSVFAAEVDVPTDGSSTTRLVNGNFTVTKDDLNAMGYGPKVSVPLSVSLTFDSSAKSYSGTGEVYAYGVVDSGKKVSVAVDDTHEKYGRAYNASEQDCTQTDPQGFSCTLSKTAWNQSECYANMAAKNDSGLVTNTGDLSVTVSKNTFLPRGTGAHKTYIPLVIEMTEE